jgi:FixJ family two-component response regulator
VQGSVISIIDDDASVRAAEARLLTSMGFAVHAFASANEFLTSPLLKDTLCIVADVEMPGMSGLELQDHLIAHGANIPVIFVTAFPEDRARERAMKGGAVCFLSKPFDDAALLECVERTLKDHDGMDDSGPAT